MKQFDVFSNTAEGAQDFAPFVVVLSSHLIDLELIVVAPLLVGETRALGRLDVPVKVHGRNYLLAVTELAGIPSRHLGRSFATVADQEDAIRRALDRLFTGF